MGYETLLRLEASRGNYVLDNEEWNKCVDNVDISNDSKYILKEIYGEDGIPGASLRWIFEVKDDVMCKVSLLYPDLTLKLEGDGEEHGDEWSEEWKNGKRIKFEEQYTIAGYMVKELKKEHPELYKKYTQAFYDNRYKWRRYNYDAEKIMVGDIIVDNHYTEELSSETNNVPVILPYKIIIPCVENN